MVQGIDEGEGGGAIECSAVVKGSGDTYRCLVDIWDAEINFSHVEVVPQYRGVEGVGISSLVFRGTDGSTYITMEHCKDAV